MICTNDNGIVTSGATDKSHFNGHYDNAGEGKFTLREWMFARPSGYWVLPAFCAHLILVIRIILHGLESNLVSFALAPIS